MRHKIPKKVCRSVCKSQNVCPGIKTRKLSLKLLADGGVLLANDPENVVSAALPVAALAPDPKAKIRAETSVSKATTVPTAARNSQGMREPWLNLTKAKNF